MRDARWPFAAGLATAMAAGLISVGLLVRPAQIVDGPPPDDDDDETMLPPAAHEPRDFGFVPFVLGGVAVLMALAGAMALAAWLYPGSVTDSVLALPLPRYPEPRLQTAPPADMAALRADQLRRLEDLSWIDRPSGVVHLPIEDAMRALARDGVADWPTTARVQR